MKLFKLTFVLTVLMSMVGLQAFAAWDTSTKVQVDDLYYYLDKNNNLAQITSMSSGKYTGDITIPSSFTYNNTNYSVTSIGNDAFINCFNLTSITIPESVTSIGTNAFYNCSGLTSMFVESGNTKYDSRNHCNAIIETASNTLIAGCKNTIIPNSVTNIGDYAFYYRPGLTSVTIPNSVTSIGRYAFCDCTGLTSIIIPESVTIIGDYAFSNTTWFDNQPDGVVYAGLNAYAYKGTMQKNTAIIIEDGTKSISSFAFRGCSGLTSITIPNSVTSIGDNAFDGCSGLTSITIPESVTTIGIGAFFSCSGLISINIPESVTSIGDFAFHGCSSLTSVTIPNSMTSIGDYAFDYCSGLTSVTIPNSVTSIGWGAFYGCSSLTSINIPDSVISIGGWAFYECSRLTSATIGNSVTNIGDRAFYYCDSLTSITIGNSVTNIGKEAFYGCYCLTSVTLNSKALVSETSSGKNMMSIFGSQVKEYILSGGITKIGNYAFSGYYGLTSITIPNSVTSIGFGAFSGCSGLTSITIPNSVTNIGISAFYNCSGLTSITIPNSVTIIGEEAFYGCSGLTSVTIPNSVTTIGKDAFYKCSGLKQVIVNDITAWCGISFGSYGANPLYCAHHLYSDENKEIINLLIPNNVTSIGNQVFFGCSNLTSITIPNSVTSIGTNAFYRCSGLTSITIPNSVTNIGISAFYNCSGLTSITISNSVTSIGNNAFSGCSSLKTVNISDVEKWSQISFGNNSANPLYYAKHLYLNGEEVKKVNIANDVSNYAFINCEGLTEVIVKGVGTDTFKGCPNITSVKVDCEIIGNYNWFADSKAKVETLTLGESVTTINANSFDGFSALKKIYLGSNLAIIGSQAFANCGKIEDVYCYAVRCPSIERNTFENSYIDYLTLHVPAVSLNDYKNHDVWSKFKAVVPLTAEETDIERITMVSGTDSAPIIYNMNGQRISNPKNGLNIINGRKVLIK